MRLMLDPRAARLLRSLPRTSPYGLVELLLLLALAWQLARLVWVVLTPVGPLGDWRPAAPELPAAPANIAATFDPFFRLSGAGAGPVVVTELNLKLFGTRADQATGRGSAIIGLPDGSQQSFAVGDQILPGVTLTAVSFDGITIARGGAAEQLFLDQSTPAQTVSAVPTGSSAAIAPPAPQGQATAAALVAGTQLSPRIAEGAVTGVTLQPTGDGAAFRAAGLQPGDVLVSVNGQPIRDAADAQRFGQIIQQDGGAGIEVERGGARVALRVQVAK